MTRKTFDYSKLLERMKSYRYNKKSLANTVDIDYYVLCKRFLNKTSFKQEEILAIASTLNIKRDEIVDYFFTLK